MTPAPADVAAVLNRAARLVDERGKTDWFARNLDGQPVDSAHPYDGAGPVCAAGAMHLAVHGYPLHQPATTYAEHCLFEAAESALSLWLIGSHIPTWSDACTRDEVAAGLRGAARIAQDGVR